MAIEILRNGPNTKVGTTQEVRAKYLKNKLLKYLRVPRDDRPKYYLSRYELVKNTADTKQARDEVTHRIERIIPDKEMINPGHLIARDGHKESIMLRLGSDK